MQVFLKETMIRFLVLLMTSCQVLSNPVTDLTPMPSVFIATGNKSAISEKSDSINSTSNEIDTHWRGYSGPFLIEPSKLDVINVEEPTSSASTDWKKKNVSSEIHVKPRHKEFELTPKVLTNHYYGKDSESSFHGRVIKLPTHPDYTGLGYGYSGYEPSLLEPRPHQPHLEPHIHQQHFPHEHYYLEPHHHQHSPVPYFDKHALAMKTILWPLAGLALLGAAAALVSNPVLLQLGVVSNGKRRRRSVDYQQNVVTFLYKYID